jgi:uncharacterized membrane protein YoaK (UPF0700 family)
MSGNTVQVGIGLATLDDTHFLRALSPLGLFALGSFAGALLFASAGRWTFAFSMVLHAAALCFAPFIVMQSVPAPALAIAPLAFAMGLQNQIIAKTRADNAGTTFVTGTLFRFGDALARFLVGTDRSAQSLRLLLVVIVFAAGAVGGAVSTIRYGTMTLTLPAALAAVIAILALLVEVTRAIRDRLAARRPAP